MPTTRPILGITMGDPAGIGPEIIIKALHRAEPWEFCVPIVFGDPMIMKKAATLLSAVIPIRRVGTVQEVSSTKVIHVLASTEQNLEDWEWGRLDGRCGRAQVDFVRRAVDSAKHGEIHAVVTCPIHKIGLKLAGIPYPGHTEMLADWTGGQDFAMMLVGAHLRVVPVTLHLPLGEAVRRIKQQDVVRVIRLAQRALRDWFGLHDPRVAVSGLNPHAGEGGLFGTEEQEIIRPAVEICRQEGIQVRGPISPDTVFRLGADGCFDVVVAMYHDQGLIPLKLLDHDNAVNLTLGIPIIRTSVDHGTAYDIAGSGKASEGSLLAAIQLAAELARKKFDSGQMIPKSRAHDGH